MPRFRGLSEARSEEQRFPIPLGGHIPLCEGDIDQDMARIGTIKEADKITGGLTKPSKMPSCAYNRPASECKVGARL